MSYSTSRGTAARPSGPLRRALTALLAVTALLTGALAVAPAAQAANTASLSGTATTATDSPVTGSWLELYRVDGSSEGQYVTDTYLAPDGDGSFSFDELAPGTYTVATYEDGYNWQYAGGAADARFATKTTLADDQDGELDIVLSEGRTLSGTLRKTNGQPVGTQLYVDVFEREVYGGNSYVDCCAADGWSNEDGTYEFSGILAGEYTVRSYDDNGYVGRWYGDVKDEEDAKIFTVTAAADKTGVDITVPLGGTVTGVVRGANGQLLDDVDVDLLELRQDPWGLWEVWDGDGDGTDSEGRYEFTGVEGGVYTLLFEDEDGNHAEQFLGGVTGLGGATRFQVELGKTKTVDAKLLTKPFVSPSTPSITLDPAKRAYGKASTATVKVTPTKSGVTATGSVTLKDGGTVLGTKTLGSGSATFDLPKTLAVGTHALTATFATDGVVQSSASAPVTLTVTKATAKVRAKVNKAKTEVVVKVRSAAKAKGKVVLKRGKQTLDSARLKKRKATLSLEGLDAGKNKLRVIYQGSAKVRSAQKKLTVKIA
jgi:hypothetical protein